ncbi:MAG TPA: TlpA disulfide reductase family protein [Flavobacterium sp.]|jgi:peroxiredoxin|nr:TlpA disulfide reductase family protein [Flavobacterium sp.]
MKKVLWILAISAAVISCNKAGDDEFVLTGSVQGVDGRSIILERQDDSLGVVAIDTVKVEDGKFKFEGKAIEPAMHSLTIDGVQNKSYLIVENGDINIEINKDSIFLNKVTGTYNNEQLTEFSSKGIQFQKRMIDFQKKNQATMIQAQNQKDTAAMNKLRTEFQKIQTEMEASNLEYIKKHPKAFISLLLINNMFRIVEPDIVQVETLYNGLDKEVKNTTSGKTLARRIAEFKKVGIGKYAPDFSAPNPEGKKVSLKESMGKVTIIDFWASWCMPCRVANPELVKLYNEYHDKGLNIIGVSLDKAGDAAKWKEAIAKDNLTWTQVSNLKHWEDPIAVQYGVKSIPQMFILNQYGVIVAKDLKGEALRAKVAQFLQAK